LCDCKRRVGNPSHQVVQLKAGFIEGPFRVCERGLFRSEANLRCEQVASDGLTRCSPSLHLREITPQSLDALFAKSDLIFGSQEFAEPKPDGEVHVLLYDAKSSARSLEPKVGRIKVSASQASIEQRGGPNNLRCALRGRVGDRPAGVDATGDREVGGTACLCLAH